MREAIVVLFYLACLVLMVCSPWLMRQRERRRRRAEAAALFAAAVAQGDYLAAEFHANGWFAGAQR